jgi:hypothetical protein
MALVQWNLQFCKVMIGLTSWPWKSSTAALIEKLAKLLAMGDDQKFNDRGQFGETVGNPQADMERSTVLR